MITSKAYLGSSNVIKWFFREEKPGQKPVPIAWITGYKAEKMELYINNTVISSEDNNDALTFYDDGVVIIKLGELSNVFNNRKNVATLKVFAQGDNLGEEIVHTTMPTSSAKILTIM